MAEALKPCPGCGKPGTHDYCGRPCCPDCGCGFMASRDETWNHREPGPATRAMAQETTMALREGWGETVINQGTMEEFLREWNQEVPE